jgi:hypothetical protein
MGQPGVATFLQSHPWVVHETPFRFITATEAFRPEVYADLQAAVLDIFARGLGDAGCRDRLARNMQNSDAYAWNLPPGVTGPLELFLKREWHDLLAGMTDSAATLDVNAAVHYHPPGSPTGRVHTDLSVAYFSDQRRKDGVNPMDLCRCAYTSGETRSPDALPRRVVRSVTAIIYVGNGPWAPELGGATGLYARPDQPVDRPSDYLPPRDNSLLVFLNHRASYHSFMTNQANRFSIICWLHQPWETAVSRYGDAITSWR